MAACNPPPVKILLSAVAWLSARQRKTPSVDTLRAIVQHLQLLAHHPAAEPADLLAALRLASEAEGVAIAQLAQCAGLTSRLH